MAPKQVFLSPPPGFETQHGAEEGNAVRGALALIMGNARVPIPEKLASISQGLIWAAANNEVAILTAILSCRTDPNSKTGTPLEATPIHFAAFCGHASMVELLVKSGAQLNAQDNRGRTCLDWAVVGNQVGLLRKLARDGAMLGAGVGDGRCGLDYAAAIGNVKAVSELVAMGVPLDRGDSAQRTALHWASVLGRTSVVRLLLHAGANPDATSRDQSTPLHWAVAAGHGLCVAELLTGGANPGLVDRRGQRPLDVAASFGKRDLVEMLVDGGAPALESALLSACRAGRACNAGHVETLKSLIRLGVDLNCRDENGRTAAEVVKASGGLPEMIAVLTGTKVATSANSNNSSIGLASSSAAAAASGVGVAGKLVGSAVGGSVMAGAPAPAPLSAPAPPSRSERNEEKEKRFKNKNKKKEKAAAAASAASASSASSAGGGGIGGGASVGAANALGGMEDDDGELSNVVHIGSLPSIPGGTLWEAIKTTMSQFGNVRQVRMTPKSTFAFVEYDTVDEAVLAVSKCAGTVAVHGSPCTVSWATRRKRKGRKSKGPTEGGMNSNNSGSGVGGGGGGGGGGAAGSEPDAPPKSAKKKNLCNLFVETGSCSWGANCKYSHDTTKRKHQ